MISSLSRRSLATLVTAALIAIALVLPVSALATFPGRNGKIAFVRNGDIWAINADGSGLQQITTNPAPDMSPAWNADGSQIVFTRFRNGNWDVFRYVVDGPNPPVAVTNTDVSEYTPAWAPDDRRVAYAREGYMGNFIFVSDVDGSNARQVGGGFNPEWSPDGRRIVADNGGETGALFLITPDESLFDVFPGTDSHDGERVQLHPSWAPTGDRVVFFRAVYDSGGVGVSQAIAYLDGREPTFFPGGPIGGYMDQSWSPDGRFVALESSQRIYVVSSSGGASIPVTRDTATSTEPAWQPLKALNPAPSVSSLSPAAVPVGSAGLTLVVNGSGFVASSVVRVNGEDRPTTFVSASRLLAEVPATDLDVAGEARVTVFSPSPGGGLSASRILTVQGPAAVAPPRVLAAPVISGSPKVGELLSCSTGTWSNNPSGYAFAWLRMGVAIPGAASASRQVSAADAGRGLACRVEATNAGGTSSAVSDEVLVAAELPAVAPPVITPPVITGGGATPTPLTPPAVVKKKAGLIGVGAPSSGRIGSPLRVTATFTAVPSGRVVLQRRIRGRFVNSSSLVPRSTRVTLTFTPQRAGLQLLRVRYSSAGVQRTSRTIVIRVRAPL